MTITAEIIADSISKEGKRLTTYKLRYPRFIHAEFMTHRVFSRNASSSRAIPTERLIQDIIDNPVEPIYWGKNMKGMQAQEELTGQDKDSARWGWMMAQRRAIEYAEYLNKLGAHKQIVNRILEPFSHINVVCTATEYENFFALRRHKDAQPEIKMLADSMWDAREKSIPMLLKPGEWHVPFYQSGHWKPFEGSKYDSYGCSLTTAIKISVASSARTSYMTHDGRTATEAENTDLCDRLLGSEPLHASPAEHQATPDEMVLQGSVLACYADWKHPGEHGNLKGFRQYRKMLLNEYVPG